MIKDIFFLVISCILFVTANGQSNFLRVDKFSAPVGDCNFIPTEKKDGDGWYNANDFGETAHLGEDWNAESGGNTDCGAPVYSVANGQVVFSKNIGGGWGEVVIIRHQLKTGEWIETLYAHLKENEVSRGEIVLRQEQIGTIGDAKLPCGDSHPYLAHLHFELRLSSCPEFGEVGPGYSNENEGWVDPSDFMGF